MKAHPKVQIWIAIIVVVLVTSGFIVWQMQRQSGVLPSPAAVEGAPDAGPTDTGTYTMAEVSKHTDATNCWSVIDGFVYDLTTWVPRHPGGEQAILSVCGKDGSGAFHAQHGDSQFQQQILATMKVGVLVR